MKKGVSVDSGISIPSPLGMIFWWDREREWDQLGKKRREQKGGQLISAWSVTVFLSHKRQWTQHCGNRNAKEGRTESQLIHVPVLILISFRLS